MQGSGAGGAPRVKPRHHPRNWAMSHGAEELTSSFTFCFLPAPMLSFSSSSAGVVWRRLGWPDRPIYPQFDYNFVYLGGEGQRVSV